MKLVERVDCALREASKGQDCSGMKFLEPESKHLKQKSHYELKTSKSGKSWALVRREPITFYDIRSNKVFFKGYNYITINSRLGRVPNNFLPSLNLKPDANGYMQKDGEYITAPRNLFADCLTSYDDVAQELYLPFGKFRGQRYDKQTLDYQVFAYKYIKERADKGKNIPKSYKEIMAYAEQQKDIMDGYAKSVAKDTEIKAYKDKRQEFSKKKKAIEKEYLAFMVDAFEKIKKKQRGKLGNFMNDIYRVISRWHEYENYDNWETPIVRGRGQQILADIFKDKGVDNGYDIVKLIWNYTYREEVFKGKVK